MEEGDEGRPGSSGTGWERWSFLRTQLGTRTVHSNPRCSRVRARGDGRWRLPGCVVPPSGLFQEPAHWLQVVRVLAATVELQVMGRGGRLRSKRARSRKKGGGRMERARPGTVGGGEGLSGPLARPRPVFSPFHAPPRGCDGGIKKGWVMSWARCSCPARGAPAWGQFAPRDGPPVSPWIRPDLSGGRCKRPSHEAAYAG